MIILRYTKRGWLRSMGGMFTGSTDFNTGRHIPYVRDGKEWPDLVRIWVGPFDTARAAYANATA